MKRVCKFLGLILMVALISGCEKNEELKVTKCTLTNNNLAAQYNLKSEYTIYSKNNVVDKVETKETVISSSNAILDYFETYLTNLYKKSNETYGGYSNKIVKENDQLTSTTTINYQVMDTQKYVEDNSAMKNYLNEKNKLTLEGIKSIYTSLGAICE